MKQTLGCLQRSRRRRIDDTTSNATSRPMTIPASALIIGIHLERMLHA